MNIIIPMAGMGKRMRPHTLTLAKPCIPIAVKPVIRAATKVELPYGKCLEV